MTLVYRITDVRYADDPLSGVGASLTGGRWNSLGTRMGYTSASRALAMMELLVHVGRDNVPANRVLVTIDIPVEHIERLVDLPEGWGGLPYSEKVQDAGDRWIRSKRSLALRVPSAIVPNEHNVLVNPLHPNLNRIAILGSEALDWDHRLFG